ncbi:regulator of chromosome condensation 1/beta-lactamase-inhibitor protein II [Lineolata rhizophorae]|uniref:Regulator of chromosome condensation 1/beta-lactamase-inhibitor protein II n=1 Tax=Lineolata rhizophorae TaxID=578093 RepID=A0A6A6P933_9PEZI|nr:regulator of chromosome condensation 1/beta-lactamase-inhibitor protein II [Lineolata rhizophorae]
MVELYACGFNAFRQIKDSTDLPDIRNFIKIASGHEIKVLFASWNVTIYRIDGKIIHLGTDELEDSQAAKEVTTNPSDIYPVSFFGTEDGVYGAISNLGTLCSYFPPTSIKPSVVCTTSMISRRRDESEIHILQFPNGTAFRLWMMDMSDAAEMGQESKQPYNHAPKHFHLQGQATQLCAGTTFFVLLTESGQVWTWGDARHRQRLARPLADSSVSRERGDVPADEPGHVGALDGVPINKIAACGSLAGAVSRDRDLYVWGDQGPQASKSESEARRLSVMDEEGDVKLSTIDDEVDILDVGIGYGHIIAVVEGGRVFAAGEAGNGQLGLGENIPEFVKDWTEVESLKGLQAEGVTCGPEDD